MKMVHSFRTDANINPDWIGKKIAKIVMNDPSESCSQ
jgi:hypothetical protein